MNDIVAQNEKATVFCAAYLNLLYDYDVAIGALQNIADKAIENDAAWSAKTARLALEDLHAGEEQYK